MKGRNLIPLFVAICIGLLVFGTYLKTLSPSIAGGDSGELMAEGCKLGTSHPPGYPLFTLITYLLSRHGYFPQVMGSPAKRVNAFSALCTAFAVVVVGMIVNDAKNSINLDSKNGSSSSSDNNSKDSSDSSNDNKSSSSNNALNKPLTFDMRSRFPGGTILAAGMFGFSPLIWQYAVTAEVFPLNTALCALIVYLVLSFARSRSIATAYWGAFVCGLALCNQHTAILYEVPLILWMLFLLRRKIFAQPSVIFILSACFIFGLLPYIYLPIAAIYNPVAGSWGHVTTFEGFIHHFLRRDYGTFQLFSGNKGKETDGLWARNAAYWNDLTNEQGLFIVSWLAVFGAIAWILRSFYVTFFGVNASGRGNSKGNKPANVTGVISPANNNKKKNSSNTPTSAHTSSTASTSSANTATTLNPNPNSNSIQVSTDNLINSKEAACTPFAIILTQIFYFAVFHSLANLPLGDKLLFGVHQRFWMQPAVISFALAGIGFDYLSIIIASVLHSLSNSFTSSGGGGGQNGNSKSKNTSENNTYNNQNNKASLSLFNAFNIVGMAGAAIGVALVMKQYQKWLYVSDQSEAMYFHRYARALLDPLPQNSIVLINYDMQWTSVRYLQQCEHYRPDITSINLSMMTYRWFKHKSHLYSNVNFPGTYHGSPHSVAVQQEGGYTLTSFIEANVDHRPIFLGGKINSPEPQLEVLYDLVPTGLLRRFVPKSLSVNASVFMSENEQNWKMVTHNLRDLPKEDKYTEWMWEWTIGRDFKDAVLDTAAYFLEESIKIMNVDPYPLINAIYWLETSMLLEKPNPPPMLLKNTGLAHVHLVQNKALTPLLATVAAASGGGDGTALPYPKIDLFNSINLLQWPKSDYKLWSSERFANSWGAFVRHPDGPKDSQYATIKAMYDAAMSARPGGTGGTAKETFDAEGGEGARRSGKKKKKKSSSKKTN